MLRGLKYGAAIGLVGAIAGCSSLDVAVAPSAPMVAPDASYKVLPPEPLIGKWGLASYRDPKDRARTENMARVQCKNPYVITKGPTDGVMMHVADDPEAHELELKKAADGKTYVGFSAPPGDAQDREVLELAAKVMVMRFVDPDTNGRYGTFVYARC